MGSGDAGVPGLTALKVQEMTPDSHVVQKYGGEGIMKVRRISLNLLALKTEKEGRDDFETCFIL